MPESSAKQPGTPRKRRLGDLGRLLDLLKAHGVSEYSDGAMTVRFPPPPVDMEALAAALDKARAEEDAQITTPRRFSDGDRKERQRLPHGEAS